MVAQMKHMVQNRGMRLSKRTWVPPQSSERVEQIATRVASMNSPEISDELFALAKRSRIIHERECFNLNPATNVMNPKAERILASGLGPRVSLGYPGEKYEMGLEAVEEIEVIAAELAARVFDTNYAEIRVPSGAIANMYGFMATCKPGDTIIVPPPAIGGHVTHHISGCAGLYGLNVVQAPVDADGYTVDGDKLAVLAVEYQPKLITIGGSLNLFEHPVAQVREIAEAVGAKVLFDAAHQCGMIAGGVWANPLKQGAHIMTMSTYKSLGGPPSGLILTNDPELAQKIEGIAFPGMTANFDVAKSASLAISLLDWIDYGSDYAKEMVDLSVTLADELAKRGVPVFSGKEGFTKSHQFAIRANGYGGGQTVAKRLRKAGLLASGIGLPGSPVAGDMNGLRIGTPELVRWGMKAKHAATLAELIANASLAVHPEDLFETVSSWRAQFKTLHYMHG